MTRRSVDRYFFIDSLSIEDLITESQPDAVELIMRREIILMEIKYASAWIYIAGGRATKRLCACACIVCTWNARRFFPRPRVACRVMRSIEISSPVDIHTGCPWPIADFLLTTDCCVIGWEKRLLARYLVNLLFKRKTIEVGHWRY